MPASHRINLARERFKFSCAHMTVFPDGRKEHLHGHNFYLGLSLELTNASLADMVDFGPLKAAATELCLQWRESTLLARDCPQFDILRDDGEEFEFRLCGKRYLLPREDVRLLPVENISVECLAAHACSVLCERLAELISKPSVVGLEVTVSESPGQGASCYRAL